MKKHFYIVVSVFFCFAFLTIGFLISCKKTDSPLGVYAPNGLDRPTYTPTPQTGAIEVWVLDNNTPIQSVNMDLIDPRGNTVSTQKTQPAVGFAAFNPNPLTTGIWTVRVPTQSVSYVLNSNSTLKYYGNSSLPITVTGSGQYAATFTTSGNSVTITPSSQQWGLTNPANLPVTVIYVENGNLDVPVSVSMSGIPSVTGFTVLNPVAFVMGGGVTEAPVTIVKNVCYDFNINLSLQANNFVGTSITTSPASLSYNYPIGISFSAEKTSFASGWNYYFQLNTTNDCGIAWNCIVTTGSTNLGSSTFTSGGAVIFWTGTENDLATFTVSSGLGTFSSKIYFANVPANSWTNFYSTQIN